MNDIIKLGSLAGAILAFISLSVWISRIIRVELRPLREIKEATRSSMQYTITRAHEEYRKAGEISTYSMRCLTDLHEQYKALGGNSFCDALMKDIRRLPMSSQQGRGNNIDREDE